MQRVRLKRILDEDFRKSPRTLYDEFRADKKRWLGELHRNETYLFISKRRNQLFFVLSDIVVINRPGTLHETTQRMLDFRWWHMEGSTFNSSMIENYANHVGLTIVGMRRMETWFQKQSYAARLARIKRETLRAA